MTFHAGLCCRVLALCLSVVSTARALSQVGPQEPEDSSLQFIVYLTRHGVRSPTGKQEQYNKFAAAPWPQWDVPPGYLTAHGFQLMKLFGAYDRMKLAGEGLMAPSGCSDAGHISILADSDQRTRETGKAIAEGFLPGCTIQVQALPDGKTDPLFHFLEVNPDRIDHQLAAAAIAGRIGGDANSLTEAYRPQLTELDRVLAGCGPAAANAKSRLSLFDIPSSLAPGTGDHPADLRGPLNTASTLSELLLLEYTEGMSAANTGWGCVNGAKVRGLIQLHSAAADFAQRTPAIARMYSSNLLDNIEKALEQSATGKAVAGAPGKPSDRVLFLVGHDTNIASLAGALGLTWIIDGRRDDTPPGGALVFALWRSRGNGKPFVRVSFTAQTLEEMRDRQALTLENPPADVSVFVPGCSKADASCDWADFKSAVQLVTAVEPVR
jgi:4-phytase/acid phosphatase